MSVAGSRPLAGTGTTRFPLRLPLHVAILDRASPAAFLGLLGDLCVSLEPVQIAADRALRETHPASGFLDQAFGFDVEAHLDPGEPRRELVEGDDPPVQESLLDVPLDALVRALLDDLGLEALGDAQTFVEISTVASST